MRSEIIKARKDRQLTIQEAADEIGISKSYYWMIEHGQRTPSGRVAMKMSNFLNRDIKLFLL